MFNPRQKIILCCVLIIVPLSFLYMPYAQAAQIADYPDRPINFIIPFPPGTPSDLVARLITREAEKFLRQPLVPVNKPGGSLTLGVASVAAAKPDGYTIGLSIQGPLVVVPFIEKVSYHPVNDLRQIMQFGEDNFGVLVKAGSQFKSFKEFMDYARQNPKKLTLGRVSNTIPHFIMEMIFRKENIQLTQMPFKGANEYEAALLGGHIDVFAGAFNYSLVEAGQTKPLLLLRETRTAEFPQIPILQDVGYKDIPAPTALGVQGPKGISDGIAQKIEEAFTLAMKEPAFVNGMHQVHQSVTYRSGKELSDYVTNNYQLFGKKLKEMGFAK